MVPTVLGSKSNNRGRTTRQFGARIYYGSPWPAYVLAFFTASVAAAISLTVTGPGGLTFPFTLFYVAAAVATWFGGWGPGFFVIPVGAIYASAFYLNPPAGLNWLWFLTVGPVLVMAVEHQRRLHDRDRDAARELVNFKLVGDHASDWILLLDEGMNIRYVNLTALTGLGWSEAELKGRSIESLMPEEQQPTLRSAIASAKPSELVFEHRDKSLVLMEIGCTTVETEEGRIIHLAARDVRERKEIARKIEELRHWESLRTLAGGLAHDFNNLLTAILGNASLARSGLAARHEAAPLLNAIVKSAQQSEDLVQMLLATSGYRGPVSEPVQLDQLLDSALERGRLPARIRIAKEAEATPVNGDRQAFETLLWSLISNAAEAYGEEGGEVRVAIHPGKTPVRTPAPQAATFEEGDAGTGECLGIVIEDHGAGMSKEVLDHAFDPFFSTKFAGRGLGLAAVRGIVRAYCGKLFLETIVGQGTRVEVWLPNEPRAAQPKANTAGMG